MILALLFAQIQSPDPHINCWLVKYSGLYARVVQLKGNNPVTTWPSQSLGTPHTSGSQPYPAYADVQEVGVNDKFVFVHTTGLASHGMGPWTGPGGTVFDNWPTNQNAIYKIPLQPHEAKVKRTNGLGAVGVWANGVALFNLLDSGGYNTATKRDQMFPGGPRGVWVRDAVVNEAPSFDINNAHQPPMGTYHYHSNPTGLRLQLNDNITLNRNGYEEMDRSPHHSPILGWAFDGYPVYGPYGYSDPKDPKSQVRRMLTGFVLRDGENGTDNLYKMGRTSLAPWAAKLHNTGVGLPANMWGPTVDRRFQLGHYVEDYTYLGDLGKIQGKDFDLDVHNGRFCVTPEFPNGTYAYFVTLGAFGKGVFPYVLGRQYFGEPTGGPLQYLTSNIRLVYSGGPRTPITVSATATVGGWNLTWNSVEGGHYQIESSLDEVKWKVENDNVQSGGLTTKIFVKGTSQTKYRVTLSGLDAYDSQGNTGPNSP